MKTFLSDAGKWLKSLLIIVGVLCGMLVTAPSAVATPFNLYLIPSTGTNITGDAGTTNLPSGNTAALGATNGRYDTFLSTTAPGAANTRMREQYSTGGVNVWYSLGRAYYSTGYGSNVTISANATGRFYLRSSAANDRFKFVLRDYNPAAGGGANGALIAESIEYTGASTSTTPSAFTIAFGNAAYTLPAGHYVEVEVMYNPLANSRTGYVYCNKDYTSYISLEVKAVITATAGSYGSISPAGATAVDVGGNQAYTITADSGKVIQSLSVDGTLVPAAAGLSSYTYTFSNVTANHSIDVSFVTASYTVTISPSTGGDLSLSSSALTWPGGTTQTYIVLFPGTLTFVATPAAGYGIEDVYINGVAQGVPLGQTTPYTFDVSFPGTTSITVAYLPYHTVTSSAGTGGIIDPAGTTSVLHGQSLTFDVTPDFGYLIQSITDNGVTVGNTSPYTLTNVTTDHTVIATFTRAYTISAVAGPNGTISPIGSVQVDAGTDRNFTMSPNLGFKISDVLIDGVSVGAVTSYTFNNVSADHTIEVTFETAPLATTYCAMPPFVTTSVPPNVMLMLSVETPMQGPANPTVTCTGAPSSATFACTSNAGGCGNGALGCYDNTRTYYGYFESGKCYSYAGSGSTGLFTPSGAATNHQCGGTAWSGNFLNWSTTLAVDAFRKSFTGGNRAVDTATDTVILAARHQSSWFPDPVRLDDAGLYTPYTGTRYFKRSGLGQGFAICNAGQTNCTVGTTGSGEAIWPTAGANTQAVFSLRIKACSTVGGKETRCNSVTNKPEGVIQKYMDRMRFGLMSYAADNDQRRDGGVLRARMKWVLPTIPLGLAYHDSSNVLTTCITSGGCANPEKEVNADGTFVSNPDSVSGSNSGVINYLNKFAYTSGYKSYDPAAEMYYEVVRYFKNLGPSGSNYCNGLSSPNDGFAVYCNSSKTNVMGWRDPALYSCSQNFVVAINDANPWLDKRIPGSAFVGNYGGSAASGTDWCGSSQGACDADFTDGGVQVNVLDWTNKAGNYEGITPANWTVGCVVNNTGACTHTYQSGGQTEYVTELGKVIGSAPGYGKENSYNMAGLAYYAHRTDLRPDLSGNQILTTYMIDTQEPATNMLVGPKNMLYLSAKFGGFDDLDGDGKPYKHASCGGVSATPDAYCTEWDVDNDGYPDTYFFASEAAKVENGLNTAFNNLMSRSQSGTAATVGNNKSGAKGANVIQAAFYPQWYDDKSVKWLGEVQALWYHLDPMINYSTIREDTDQDHALDLTRDLIVGSDPFTAKALWKGGAELHDRTAASRSIYSLLNTSVADLTNTVNNFTTTQRSTLKPLMNISALSDAAADTLINYIRGVDDSVLRPRTVTYNTITNVWKLGDVVNSTPQVSSSLALNSYDTIYDDSSYAQYCTTNQYKARNVVFAGANDGMLHTFKLGLIDQYSDASQPSRIAGVDDSTDIGKEEWAYIPRSSLPYLVNQTDVNYCHQYLVDGTPLVFDASINRHSDCTETNYWSCPKKTTYVSGTKNLDGAKTSWKSVLIGGMGLGGASRDGNCNETFSPDGDMTNNTDCIKSPVSGNGLSSYFALDVTDPLAPKQLWELSDSHLPAADKGLGLTTPGPAIVRINVASGTPAKPDKRKNGRWFVVFASGPTGPIDTNTRQFLGRSDQNLKLYIVDVNAFDTVSTFTKGVNYWLIDTGKKFAFANSLSDAVIDLDRKDSTLQGNYSDDAVYIAFTKATLDGSGYPTAWDKGGVLRLITNNNPDPSTWFISDLIDDIGPVTSSVGKLQDRKNNKLWIYFGEGRYFFQGDDLYAQRRIFGVADPCYGYDYSHQNTLATAAASCASVALGSLKNQTSTPSAPLGAGDIGWYINLDAAIDTKGTERMVSDVSAQTNGVVFFTTFIPNTDICQAGGNTSMWAVNYKTGGTAAASALIGKAPLQTSGGNITMVDFSTAFTQNGGRKLNASLTPPGMPPKGKFAALIQPKPVKQILNIQER